MQHGRPVFRAAVFILRTMRRRVIAAGDAVVITTA